MKKRAGIMAAAALVAVTTGAIAAERGTPEYDRLVALKKVQREKREAEKAEMAANPGKAKDTFWSREAERSGFAGTGAMFSNAFFNTLNLDKPGSRKKSE